MADMQTGCQSTLQPHLVGPLCWEGCASHIARTFSACVLAAIPLLELAAYAGYAFVPACASLLVQLLPLPGEAACLQGEPRARCAYPQYTAHAWHAP